MTDQIDFKLEHVGEEKPISRCASSEALSSLKSGHADEADADQLSAKLQDILQKCESPAKLYKVIDLPANTVYNGAVKIESMILMVDAKPQATMVLNGDSHRPLYKPSFIMHPGDSYEFHLNLVKSDSKPVKVKYSHTEYRFGIPCHTTSYLMAIEEPASKALITTAEKAPTDRLHMGLYVVASLLSDESETTKYHKWWWCYNIE